MISLFVLPQQSGITTDFNINIRFRNVTKVAYTADDIARGLTVTFNVTEFSINAMDEVSLYQGTIYSTVSESIRTQWY